MKKFFLFFALVFITPLAAQPADFTSVAKKAIPAVVSVKVEMKRPETPQNLFRSPFGNQENDPFGEEFWGRFFNIPRNQRHQEPTPSFGQGSGFIVTEDGYILTNNHIVEKADKVLVKLKSGKEYTARVIGTDPNTDVAVIKIDAKNLPHLPLGDSSKLEVGQWVAAIGNPLGLQATLTVGVVGAIDRNNLGLTQVEDFIQTDAAINRGNSGGPLLNMDGEAVGINTAIATHTGGYMGIGFAIPINLAAQVMEQLIQTGSFTRGYLGVVMQQMDPDLADAFGLEESKGALISEVAKDSPAEKAGLKRGDIILKFNDRPVDNISVVRNAVAMMKPDDEIHLEVKRGNEILHLKVRVGTHPLSSQATSTASAERLGLKVTELTPEIAQNFNYIDEKGVVVSDVEAGSVAQMAGIKKGSLILSVNQQEVTTPQSFYSAVEQTPTGKPVLLLIKQGPITQYLSLKIH